LERFFEVRLGMTRIRFKATARQCPSAFEAEELAWLGVHWPVSVALILEYFVSLPNFFGLVFALATFVSLVSMD
jgi:hypothetical protein